MPNAVVEADGTFSVGYSYDRPYGTLWVSAMLPFLQVTGRYVSINGIPGFSSRRGDYGSDTAATRTRCSTPSCALWRRATWLPSVAVGATDLLGTELFKGQYIVATKTFGSAQQYRSERRLRPQASGRRVRRRALGAGERARTGRWWPNTTPTTTPRTSVPSSTDAGKRRKGPAVGLEYRWGWLGAQIARHRDHFSANAYVSDPVLGTRIPAETEGAGAVRAKGCAGARVSAAEWQKDGRAGRRSWCRRWPSRTSRTSGSNSTAAC